MTSKTSSENAIRKSPLRDMPGPSAVPMAKNALRDLKIRETKWLGSVGMRLLDDIALNCEGMDLIDKSASHPLRERMRMI